MSMVVARAFVRAVHEPGELRDAIRAREHDITLADIAALASQAGEPVSDEEIRRACVEDWTLRRAMANARPRSGGD